MSDDPSAKEARRRQRKQKWALTKRLLRHGFRYKGIIVAAFLTSIVAGLALGLQVSIPKIVIDHVLIPRTPDSLEEQDSFGRVVESLAGFLADTFNTDDALGVIYLLAIVILFATGIGALASYTNEILAKSLATFVSRDLRRNLVAKLVRLPLGHFVGHRLGDLVSRFSNDIQTTYLTINIFISEVLLQPFYVIAGLGTAFLASPRLSLFSILFLPLVVLPVIIRGKRVHKRARKSMISLGDATETMNQILGGLRVVKAYQQESQEVLRFEEVNAVWSKREIDVVRTKAKGKAVMEVLYGVALAAAMTFGGYLVMERAWGLKGGDLVMFMTGLGAAYRPLKRLSVAFNKWQSSVAAAERVYEIMDARYSAKVETSKA
jgi:subfamily B ATP-binding cassette protein MsbA